MDMETLPQPSAALTASVLSALTDCLGECFSAVLCMQLTTRTFYFDGAASLMIPLLDMANHVNHCPHDHEFVPDCPDAPGQICVIWRAGAAVKKGDEVRAARMKQYKPISIV